MMNRMFFDRVSLIFFFIKHHGKGRDCGVEQVNFNAGDLRATGFLLLKLGFLAYGLDDFVWHQGRLCICRLRNMSNLF